MTVIQQVAQKSHDENKSRSDFGLDHHPPVTFHSKIAPILATTSGLAAILSSSSLKTSAVAISLWRRRRENGDEGKRGEEREWVFF
jgi:hypothetical protein